MQKRYFALDLSRPCVFSILPVELLHLDTLYIWFTTVAQIDRSVGTYTPSRTTAITCFTQSLRLNCKCEVIIRIVTRTLILLYFHV
eukprot:UN17375